MAAHQTNGNGYAAPERFPENGNHEYLTPTYSHHDALHKIRTAQSVSISPELFEKLYLNPEKQVKGDLRKKFANPTPLALVGLLLCITPLAASLMGWRGAGGGGAATIGAYFWFGGLLMILSAIGEWILGNTFSMTVFASFGSFWLTWGATLQPIYNASGAFSTTGNPADGAATVGFKASFGFLHLSMAILAFIFLICSLRTNIVFVALFTFIVPGFGILAGAMWTSDVHLSHSLHIAAGACNFVVAILSWYLLVAIMLETVDMPISLPVGDLSGWITPLSERRKRGGKDDKMV